MDVVDAELLVGLERRVVLLDEARLVEVAAAGVGAADPLALGAPLPPADRGVVEPEVLVDAQVALARPRPAAS